VRAAFREQPHAAGGGAKRDQVFAEKPHPERRAVGLGELRRERRRHPVLLSSRPMGVPGPTRVRDSLSVKG